ESLLESYTVLLEEEFQVHTAASGQEGLRILKQEDVNVVLLDIRLPDVDGIEVLREVKAVDENLDVIMITAVKNVRVAVEAIKLGAIDYLVKPFEIDEVLALLRRTMEHQDLMREVLYLRSEVDRYQEIGNIVGSSQKMHQIYDLIFRVVDTNATVLIHGESGTGKELIARAIHQKSERRSKPFVAVNCAAISEHLIESELFGHERGAFTGALEKRLGKFELANTGVLFLDEIASLRLDLQAKLLRVLQEREFERVGGSKTIRTDVRIVVATNQDLKQMVIDETFRDDLFYRLNVVPIQVPPLRERREDIPLLIDHFLDKYNKAFQRQLRGFSPNALKVLTHYHWPGNVRELENIIERLVAISPQGTLDVEHLPLDLLDASQNVPPDLVPRVSGLRQAKTEFERLYILRELEQTDWNQTEAAKRLGIHRNTLISKMEGLKLRPRSDHKGGNPASPP
ncbi:MAG: sigma-54 dependent transcriptional regulator, partial [bacterium]|nr:sigma-54 dependent transcriptional regulator [bacterium]